MKIFDIKVPLHLRERFTDLRWLEETFRGKKKKKKGRQKRTNVRNLLRECTFQTIDILV